MGKWILPSTEAFHNNYEFSGNKEGVMYTRGMDAESDLKQALDHIDLLVYIATSRSNGILSKQRISAARQFLTRFKPKEDE